MKSDLAIEDEPKAETVRLPQGPRENCGLHPGKPTSDVAWPSTLTQKKKKKKQIPQTAEGILYDHLKKE